MKYPIGTYVVYVSEFDKESASWENIWLVVGFNQDGYVLQNKVGGVIEGFSEEELSLSSDQNPAMRFDKYKFAYACGAAGRDYQSMVIDLIEWACSYHRRVVGFENDKEMKVWNGDSDCFETIYKQWCDWSFDKENERDQSR